MVTQMPSHTNPASPNRTLHVVLDHERYLDENQRDERGERTPKANGTAILATAVVTADAVQPSVG